MKKSDRKFKTKAKRITSKSVAVPAGFHPLSESMVDVLLALQKKFANLPGWWRQDAQVLVLAGEYFLALRQVLRKTSASQRRLMRCRHCKIFF